MIIIIDIGQLVVEDMVELVDNRVLLSFEGLVSLKLVPSQQYLVEEDSQAELDMIIVDSLAELDMVIKDILVEQHMAVKDNLPRLDNHIAEQLKPYAKLNHLVLLL